MAADLHIHAFAEGELTEDDFKDFFSNNMGSKWFDLTHGRYRASQGVDTMDSFTKFGNLPSVWVGEVSWLKAGLFEDPERYVPDAVNEISEIIGEDYPVIDDELIEKIRKAFDLKNATAYDVSGGKDVLEFLEENRGKRALTISW